MWGCRRMGFLEWKANLWLKAITIAIALIASSCVLGFLYVIAKDIVFKSLGIILP
jgi:hypothetical protein